MSRISLVSLAHEKISEVVRAGDTTIDATLGNGHDTLFLAKLVGQGGKVFGFDIQTEAIQKTEERLINNRQQKQVVLIQKDHAYMEQNIPRELHQRVSAIVFNLGYLPGGDKRITTESRSTLKALTDAINLLKHGGLLNLLVYVGHPAGKNEYTNILKWLDQYRIKHDRIVLHDRENAPVMFSIYKN